MTITHRFRGTRILRHIVGRPRLIACSFACLVSYAVFPGEWHQSTRMLMAWNLGIISYIATSFWVMSRATAASIRRRAIMIDESRFVVLTVCILAAVASIVAIVMQLAITKDMHGTLRFLHLGLAALTIVSSWTFTHVMFAQHYAHEYFVERSSELQIAPEFRGGISFPGGGEPNYSDFLYFTFVIAVASQTADVAVCSRPMRKVALVHCVLSFFFNTTVLALTINIAAGLI